MRQFSLRTLILVMLLGGPALAACWWWPFLGVISFSLLLTLGVLVGSLWLHRWQLARMDARAAMRRRSALATGMELSVLLGFAVASALLIGGWVGFAQKLAR
jgi:hypothetical protein